MKLGLLMPLVLLGVSACGSDDSPTSSPVEQADPVTELPNSEPAPEPMPEPTPEAETDDSDTNEFMGKPWRDTAVLATSVLKTSHFSSVNEDIESVAAELGSEDAYLNTPAEGSASCPNGGTLAWNNTTVYSTTGRVTLSKKSFDFQDCSLSSRIFDGTYDSHDEDGSVQSFSSDFKGRTYDIAITSADEPCAKKSSLIVTG